MNIYKVEAEIQLILSVDKSSWMRVSVLIKNVESSRAWQENFQSFSAWIRHLAAICKVHESIIWQRKRAGEIYLKYRDRSKAIGKETPDPNDIKVSPENLILADRIGQGVNAATDNLIDKIVSGELKRAELTSAWQSVKRVRQEYGEQPRALTRHDTIKPSESALAASDINIALAHSSWLNEFSNNHNTSSSKHGKRIYKSFSEFPLFITNFRQTSYVDILIVENITLEKAYQLNSHAISIKLTELELQNNRKLTEYTNYIDYIWVATQPDLIEFAKMNVNTELGIVEIKEDSSTSIIRKPARNTLEVAKKLELLQALIIREL